jgi:hypothetical protein
MNKIYGSAELRAVIKCRLATTQWFSILIIVGAHLVRLVPPVIQVIPWFGLHSSPLQQDVGYLLLTKDDY